MQFLLEMYDVSFFFFANKYNTEIDIFVIFPSLWEYDININF